MKFGHALKKIRSPDIADINACNEEHRILGKYGDEECLRVEAQNRSIIGQMKSEEAGQIVREQIDQGLFDYQIIKPEGIESYLQYEETVSASLCELFAGPSIETGQIGNP